MEAGSSQFPAQPVSAATRNKPETLRQLREFGNYVKPKVTISIFDTEQN